MPQTRECDYCGSDIAPGTGTMLVRTDGSTIHYCSSKCEKNDDLGREPRDVEWTDAGGSRERRAADAEQEPAAEEGEEEQDLDEEPDVGSPADESGVESEEEADSSVDEAAAEDLDTGDEEAEAADADVDADEESEEQ